MRSAIMDATTNNKVSYRRDNARCMKRQFKVTQGHHLHACPRRTDRQTNEDHGNSATIRSNGQHAKNAEKYNSSRSKSNV